MDCPKKGVSALQSNARISTAVVIIKINCDAAFCFTDKGSVGAILRDWGGTFFTAATSSMPSAIDVTIGDALAILEGLKLAHDLGFENIAVKSKCLCLVNFVNEGSVLFNPLEFIVSNLLDLLRTFQSFFFHVSHTCNHVIHRLTAQFRAVCRPSTEEGFCGPYFPL